MVDMTPYADPALIESMLTAVHAEIAHFIRLLVALREAGNIRADSVAIRFSAMLKYAASRFMPINL